MSFRDRVRAALMAQAAQALRADLEARGFVLQRHGDKLQVEIPSEATLTDADQTAIATHKPLLLAMLDRDAGPAVGTSSEHPVGASGTRADVLPSLGVSAPNEQASVGARAVAFQRQLTEWGAERACIPLLAISEIAPTPGVCVSCGEPLAAGRVYRCSPCVEAVLVMIGMSAGAP